MTERERPEVITSGTSANYVDKGFSNTSLLCPFFHSQRLDLPPVILLLSGRIPFSIVSQ